MLRAASGFILTLFTPQADSLTRCVHVWLHTVKKKMQENGAWYVFAALSRRNEPDQVEMSVHLCPEIPVWKLLIFLRLQSRHTNDNVMFFTAKTNQNAARENYRSSQAIYNEAIVFWSACWNQTSNSTEDTDTDGQILYLECRLASLDVC